MSEPAQGSLEHEPGIIRIVDDTFLGTTPLQLKGSWAYFHHTFLSPALQPESSNNPPPDAWHQLPNPWFRLTLRGETLPTTGYSSYRLRLENLPAHTSYTIKVQGVSSACTLFLNGKQVIAMGRPGADAASTAALSIPMYASFYHEGGPLDILAHVANHDDILGGLNDSISLGRVEVMSGMRIFVSFMEISLFAGLISLGSYHLIVFILRRREKAFGYFGMFCLMIAVRTMLEGERFFLQAFPTLEFKAMVAIIFFVTLHATTFFLLFFRHIFPQYWLRRIFLMFIYGTAALSLLAFILPLPVFLRMVNIWEILLIGILGLIIVTSIRAIINKQENAVLFASGFLLVAIAIVNDVFFYFKLINTGYYLPIGVLLFMFVQATTLARRYALSYGREELVAQELSLIKSDLERLVSERTLDLQVSNDSLIAARNRAEEANSAKTKFLATMSHEMRTPMNAVLGYSEAILATNPPDAHHDFAKKIFDEGNNLLGLINQLLDLVKIESGKLELEFQDFRLHDVIASVEKTMAPMLHKKNLAFHISVDAAIPDHIRGDQTRLRQVLVNLCGNAVKFTDEGSIRLEVAIAEPITDKATLKFLIIDTGIGIPDEFKPHLFESFAQARSDHNLRGGTGLGTAISRQLVNLMGGTIGFESNYGHGSTFWFTAVFEVMQQLSPRQRPRELLQYNPMSEILKAARILVVEDYQPNIDLIFQILDSFGALIDAARNGKEAVKLCGEKDYDIILMDVQMPVMDGLVATRTIRELPGMAETPILGMTANAFDHDRVACLHAGMNDVLTKPIRRKQFIAQTTLLIQRPFAPESLLDELGNPTLAAGLIAGFLKELTRQLPHMKQIFTEADFVTIRREAHSIKGGALNLMAPPVYRAALELEDAAKFEDIAAIPGCLKKLSLEFSRLEQACKPYLAIWQS